MPSDRPITAINPTVKPAGWFRVKHRTAVVALLHPAELRPLHLQVGDSITPELERRLKEAHLRSLARGEAERLLAKRAMSTFELEQFLFNKAQSRPAVDAVLRSLTESGAVNDLAMASALAASSLARGDSRASALAFIERYGIPRLLALHAVSQIEADTGQTDHDRGLKLIRSHLRPSLAAEPDHVQRRRLSGVLGRKGFDEEAIESILEETLGPPPLRFRPD